LDELTTSQERYLYNICSQNFGIIKILEHYLFLKCCSSIRSEWFLKGHVTLKTGVMVLKIQLWSQE